MSNQLFKAFVVREKKENKFHSGVEKKLVEDLPEGDLLIRVQYSSLNYKDALSASGNRGVTKYYPHTPGIDAAGVVESSFQDNFNKGDLVIVTGRDLGMNTHGGLSEYIRVPSDWAVKLPEALSLKNSMIIGTAGLTAGLSIKAIKNNTTLQGKKALVSGATGGVGSLAIKLLSNFGAEVTAITGKPESKNYLESLGATNIIDRNQFIDSIQKPLVKGTWDVAIDVVGGKILSSILSSLRYGGIIACCGNVGGPKFETTVFPFILRGNSLIGIDSANVGMNERVDAWRMLGNNLDMNSLEHIYKEIKLNQVQSELNKLLAGQITGRVLVSI